MTRFTISTRVGAKDNYKPAIGPNERLARMELHDVSGYLRYGINDILRQLKKLNLKPASIGLDLLILAVMVHSADTRVNRIKNSQDAWTREFRLIIPVINHGKWVAATDVLQRMLRFLTGDLWSIEFRTWPNKVEIPILDELKLPNEKFDSISLFSGGLDSLIGAIDHLEDDGKTLFVSHGGESTVSKWQSDLFERLQKIYARKSKVERLRWASFKGPLLPDLKPESSTRGRSFIFFSLAVMAGTCLGKEFIVRVAENGLIALNVPLDVTRLGSNSTRTTHPYYMHRWNELLSILGINGKLRNPYWDKTKGEMISECKNQKILKTLAPASLSCAHPAQDRYEKTGSPHCGYCLPCIIRRASFATSWGKDKDPTSYQVDLSQDKLISTKANGQQVRAFQYALKRLTEDPDLAQTLVYKPGPLSEDTDIVPKLIDVYRRGMGEVEKIVKDLQVSPEGR